MRFRARSCTTQNLHCTPTILTWVSGVLESVALALSPLNPSLHGGTQMGSYKSPKIAFTNSDLTELEWVYESVCTAVKATHMLDEHTKNFIRRRLFVLACNGMVDPELMRDYLIANFARQEPKRTDVAT